MKTLAISVEDENVDIMKDLLKKWYDLVNNLSHTVSGKVHLSCATSLMHCIDL